MCRSPPTWDGSIIGPARTGNVRREDYPLPIPTFASSIAQISRSALPVPLFVEDDGGQAFRDHAIESPRLSGPHSSSRLTKRHSSLNGGGLGPREECVPHRIIFTSRAADRDQVGYLFIRGWAKSTPTKRRGC